MGILDGFFSLSDDTNKSKTTGQGQIDLVPELQLEMDDQELVDLAENWEAKYKGYEAKIKKLQDENENYWLGKQFDGGSEGRPMMDNIIYEAVETYRALATKKNPEPFVRGDDTAEGQAIAKTTQQMLVFHADRLRMKIQLKTVILHKELYLLGYVKHGWDEVEEDFSTKPRRPQHLILDGDCFVDEQMEYTGKYIGERMQDTATNLINRFPSKKDYIEKRVNGKLGTMLDYTEWWANNPAEYVFWKLDKVILGKAKNPHWNYDETETVVDEYGQEVPQEVKGLNHFKSPKAPYTFLSTLNLGLQPHDKTSNIGQNLANQDIINKRNIQIDRNADSMNPGLIVSLERAGMNQSQAEDVTAAYRAGGTVCIPTGSPQEAIYQPTPPSLPPDLFNQLADKRESLRNIYGVRGSTPSGTVNEQTATGKTLIREQDSDRIGGGVTEYLEQFADHVFNWWTQMMYVHYTDRHYAAVVGAEKTMEYISIQNTDFIGKLMVSVKEGSLIPDSDQEKALESRELLAQGNIDPITAFDRMGYANPKETAERTYLWKAAPDMLFPELGQAVKASQMQEQMDQMALQEQVQPVKK